jgi:uncharacterized membrane protein
MVAGIPILMRKMRQRREGGEPAEEKVATKTKIDATTRNLAIALMVFDIILAVVAGLADEWHWAILAIISAALCLGSFVATLVSVITGVYMVVVHVFISVDCSRNIVHKVGSINWGWDMQYGVDYFWRWCVIAVCAAIGLLLGILILFKSAFKLCKHNNEKAKASQHQDTQPTTEAVPPVVVNVNEQNVHHPPPPPYYYYPYPAQPACAQSEGAENKNQAPYYAGPYPYPPYPVPAADGQNPPPYYPVPPPAADGQYPPPPPYYPVAPTQQPAGQDQAYTYPEPPAGGPTQA